MSLRSNTSALILLAVLVPLVSHAHAPSDTYLFLNLTSTNLIGRWEIKRIDLQHALGFDKPDAAAIPSQQLRLREEALALDTVSGLSIKVDNQSVTLQITDQQFVTRRDGETLRMDFQSSNWPQSPSSIELHAEIIFALDPQLRCIARLEYWGAPQQTILNIGHPVLKLSLRAPPSNAEQLLAFIREGIWHIWTGYDHILFLISLLLPAVLIWHGTASQSAFNQAPDVSSRPASTLFPMGRWTGAPALKPAIINVLKIVTAFTVAHSITLALAALHILELPTRWIESAIAASVIAAALNNLWPVVRELSWLVAFAFGLIHGFGFANVLAEAGLTKASLTMALIGFNIGVEIGQLAVVMVLVPIAYRFRRTSTYEQIILRWGSTVIIALSTVWLAERLFDFKLLPF